MAIGERGLFICGVVSLLTLTGFTPAAVAGSQAAGMNGVSSSAAPPTGSPVSLDLCVIGTVLLGDGSDMATILDRKTNSSRLYKLGEAVGNATIVNITGDGVEFEMGGQIIAVKLKNNAVTDAGTQYSFTIIPQAESAHMAGFSPDLSYNDAPALFEGGEVTRSQPSFDPVFVARGPQAPGVESDDLPHFEPTADRTGPRPLPDMKNGKTPVTKELPAFEPVTNYTGPEVKNGKASKELPLFDPASGADSGSASDPLNQTE